ncbi:MAG: hypothetical protein JNK64_08305 [Myxococcales bacterium]|nr:hypothetical protein [Myxococcales bacterium]
MTVSVPAPSRAVRLGVVDPTGVTVMARHADGTVTGPYPGGTSADPWVTVPAADVVELTVTPGKLACVYQLCLEHGLSDEELADRQDLQTHVQGEVVRWSQDGHVLEPDTAYRLRIVSTVNATGEGELAGQTRDHATEQLAYFRTGGPPGLGTLSTPEGYPGAEPFRSGLDDLTRYVRQTVPPTVPAPGQPLVQVRPVFRAYDLGVEFNEDYVELMYRLGGRDLGMYLFDGNSAPLRDPGGRLMQPRYRWARSSHPALSEAEQWWLQVVGGSPCLAIDPTVIPYPAAMVSAGAVLPPDAAIEARLVPLVFRDGFAELPVGTSAIGDGATLGRWRVDDVAAVGGPGRWVIEDGGSGTRALAQLAAIGAVPADPGDARRPGTLLRCEVTATDYRVTGQVRSSSGGAVGIAVRVTASEAGYLFVMDRNAGNRRLVRMQPGEWAVLAEDQRRYPIGRDQAMSLEVVGSSLRAYLDGVLVFHVVDAAYPAGGVALHTQSCADARWRELRVDDLGAGAPVVYRFGFTTSRFASFYHLGHGGEQRRSTVAPPAGLTAMIGAAVSPATAPTDDEHRAYDAAAALVLGPAMHRRPAALELTRLADAAGLVGFLLVSPEPIAWPRVTLALHAGPSQPARASGPGPARLAEATVGQVDSTAESVTVLVEDPVDPSAIAVEYLALPGAVDLTAGAVVFDERFPGPAGALHLERFGPGASERFTILDQGDQEGPSRWRSEDGRMKQLSPIYGGDLGGGEALRPGTMALLGDASWRDLTIDTVVRAGAPGAIGLVFRHGPTGDHYRFAMDQALTQRRLVRVTAGAATVLWEQAQGFELDRDYRLRVQVLGDTLVGWLDDGLLFHVVDPGPRLGGGQLGWYCWHNPLAEFAALEVSTLEVEPIRWTGDLGEPASWEVRDDVGAIGGPSQWVADDGLRQLTAIGGADGAGFALGTVAVAEGAGWDDVGFDVVAMADGVGTLGVQFHDRGPADHYRFTLDAAAQTARLTRRRDGVAVELWSGPGGYQPGVEVHLTITTVGDQLAVVVDGVERVRLADGTLRLGGLGLFTSGDVRARFRRAVVAERRRVVGGWRVIDEGHDHGPSRWRAAGELTEDRGVDGDGPVTAARPGTYALALAAVPDAIRVEATLRAEADGAVGVVVRWVDTDNYYRVSLDRTAGVHRLVRKAAGVTTVLWEAPGGYTPGHPLRVVIDVVGARLRGTLDGAPWFDLVDSTHPAGAVGFYAWRNPGATALRMVARRPPLEAHELYRDRFAAADLSGWQVIDEGTGAAPSQWRLQGGELHQQSLIFGPVLQPMSPVKSGTMAVVGDPTWTDQILSVRLASGHGGAIGVVFRYHAATDHYRFSMDRNARYRRLVKRAGGAHVVLWEDRVQYELDRPYELTVVAIGDRLRGYLDGVPLFDVADAGLAAGRVGLYTWHNSDGRFSQLRVYRPDAGFAAWDLSDGFASLSRLLWQPVDDALYATPSRWAADGYLRQPVPVPGTSLVGGDRGWADIRVTATVIAATAGAVGVVARYRGPGDHYALTVTSDPIGLGRAQLVATAGGVATELWEGAVAVKPGGQHLITLDVVGDRLTAWVDGNRLASVVDQTHAAGRVGVRTEQAADARVTSIRVAQARWAHYGDLAAEPGEAPLAPGMRVRVSALEVRPPTGEANLRVAATAETGGPGRAVLGPGIDPVWLRLRQRRTGQPDMVHDTLGVRRATDDVQSGARVLRRRDGTGVLVFPDTANLDSGYRLSLTFARAGIAGLPDLAEAGLNDPERVTIELP